MDKTFSLKFQAKVSDLYETIELFPSLKIYKWERADQKDMTGECIDLMHHADMINLENRLHNEGYRLRIAL